MNLPRPLLVFDLDGTIADTAPDLIGALNRTLADVGEAPEPLSNASKLVGAGGRAMIARAMAWRGRPLTAEAVEPLFAKFLAHYEAHIADESFLFPGLTAALDRFAGEGYVFAVCTNKYENLANTLLKRLEIASRFAFVCGQDTFGIGKPDPKPLLGTIAAAGGAVGRVTMVGDAQPDIGAARAAKVPVVAVGFGYSEPPVAELGADRTIGHYDELWEAVRSLERSSVDP
ncbi:MAG: HAD hydrolase-like protein [Hyphomicrobiales bacterium]|nr:HAD hydrolase-like protein [Hyphomicrobiales bacterium]MDE2017112.1 HAD hydrolase-like protein [Hyphomicrobiales bacterium]